MWGGWSGTKAQHLSKVEVSVIRRFKGFELDVGVKGEPMEDQEMAGGSCGQARGQENC